MDIDQIIVLLGEQFPGSELEDEYGEYHPIEWHWKPLPKEGKLWMVSQSQIKFFDQLLDEKDFGAADRDKLREQFATLDKKSASAWIEKGIGLPKVDESEVQAVPPAF